MCPRYSKDILGLKNQTMCTALSTIIFEWYKEEDKGWCFSLAEGEGQNAVFLAEQGMDVTVWDYAE